MSVQVYTSYAVWRCLHCIAFNCVAESEDITPTHTDPAKQKTISVVYQATNFDKFKNNLSVNQSPHAITLSLARWGNIDSSSQSKGWIWMINYLFDSLMQWHLHLFLWVFLIRVAAIRHDAISSSEQRRWNGSVKLSSQSRPTHIIFVVIPSLIHVMCLRISWRSV